MTDHPSKLQNVEPLTESADSLGTGIMEATGGDRGTGVDSGIPGAAKENVERLACHCERFGRRIGPNKIAYTCVKNAIGHIGEDVYCQIAQRDLP